MNNSALAVKDGGPARWSLRLLGGFALCDHPGGKKVALPGKRERALLAYLALSPKSRQPRRKLAALIWGDATDETLLDNLRTCIWRLRKALGDTDHRLVMSDDEDILLDGAAFDVDVLEFRRLAALSERSALEIAAKQCCGELLDGLVLDSEEFESWRRTEASGHRDQTIDVLRRLMRLFAESGEAEHAIQAGAKILSVDPLHEATARDMMKLYADNGRRGTALQLYQTLADALRRDVNSQPESATRQVFAAIAGVEGDKATGTVLTNGMSGPNRASDAPAKPPVGSPPVARFWLGWRLALAGVGAALIAIVALETIWWMAPAPPAATASAPQTAAAINSAVAAARSAPITIAVLPFDNSSGDTGLQFFSDGINQDISVALSKMSGLRLVARGAAFQLRREFDTRDIGMTPAVRYLVEGTVRLAQKRVTVTARLIRTDSGASVWSQNYERELSDVYTVRMDIAMAISEALKTPLNLASGPQPDSDPAIDPNSYEQFLRAKALVRTRYTGVNEAIEILETLVKRNPHYAPAWAFLAQCYGWMPGFVSPYNASERRRRIQIFFPMAEEAAHHAIGLDPKLAEPYLSLSHMEAFNGRWAAAEDFITKALALDLNSPDALDLQMTIYANVGYQKKALAIAERLRALEPDAVGWKQDTAEVMWENGQTDAAIEVLKSLIDRPSGPTSLSMMYASVGRYKDAADVLETALKGPGTLPETWPESFRIAAALLRKAPSKMVFPPDLPRLDRVGFVYLYAGAPDHAFDNYEVWIKSGQAGGQGNSFSYVWNASYAPARKTENFKRFARDAGFVDYWRARGWPDLCRPKGADDFDCR